MVVRELSREECHRVLAGTRLARLACAHEHQPYVVPVFLAYHEYYTGEPCLYGFTNPGQKVDWMRANPLVCVEVDEVTAHDQWVSVVVYGRYEELPETQGTDDALRRARERPRSAGEARAEPAVAGDERFRAYQVLKTSVEWWEPGYATWAHRPGRDPAEPYETVYYKIRIDRVTGREATRSARPGGGPAHPTGRTGWLGKTLERVFGRKTN
jgi:nitroimidazol reductase NimA-like FMN-containing flavoprotein (pyridoxamine 5'-phosphate oxidase superfamily)